MTAIAPLTPRILERVRTVKPLSPGAGHLLTMAGDSSYERKDIVAAIENDAGLTVGVLRAVNSATVALHREIRTVRDAIVYLGETRIIGIAIAASTGQMFNAELAGYRGTRGDLGRHCLWTAVAARELARYTDGVVDGNVAFTAGLLHDIGKAVISDFLAESLDADTTGLETVHDGAHLELERALLGTDHCAVGRALAERWQLPASLAAPIAWHHEPANAPAEHLAIAHVVHMADMLAMMFGVGTGTDDLQYALHPGYASYIRIQPQALEGLVLDVQLDYAPTAEILFGAKQEARP